MNDMNSDERPATRRLFTRTHQKRSLSRWLIPLVLILAVIFFLPKLMDLLLPS